MDGSKIQVKESIPTDETERARLERLGRERPDTLSSSWFEFGFVFSVVSSQFINEFQMSGPTMLAPEIAKALNIPISRMTWPIMLPALVVSAFLLPCGRLVDQFGAKWIYIVGILWTSVWGLVAGFTSKEVILNLARSAQGLGAAMYLPSGLQLLGKTYRPGPRKNVVFAIYGSMAALGFFVGIFFAGVVAEYAGRHWYFPIAAILGAIVLVPSHFCISDDRPKHRQNGVKMDWLGAVTTTTGIPLFVFAVTSSSHAADGLRTPYVLLSLGMSIVMLALAFYIEGWVAEQPLLPFEAFKVRYVRPFTLGLFLVFGCCGIYIYYATLYIRNILHVSPILLVAWFIPMGLGGVALATIGGFFLHRIHGNILMLITGVAIVVNSLCFALMPPKPSYWLYVFPAMCFATLAIDIIFTAASIFFTTTMPSNQQGFAGALTNVLFQLGVAVLLGFGDVVAANTHQGERQSYKNAFWLEFGCGIAALIIFCGFVRIKAAESDKTADEKAAEEAEENKDVEGKMSECDGTTDDKAVEI